MRTTKPHTVPFAQKALRAVLAAVLAVSLAPAVPAFADDGGDDGSVAQALGYMGFPDVNDGDWYATDDMLGYAVDNGLLAGYDDGRFGPYDTVTRAQVATILWRVAGEPDADAEDFSDVDYSLWYGAAVEWARTSGVVSGYGDTNTFGPDNPVTREQLAVMLSNYAVKVAGVDASSDCAALDAIAGAEGVSSWAREQMGWAVDEGILSGSVVDGVAWVDPQGTAQRCQAAKMVSVFHRDVLPPEIDADYDNVLDYDDDVAVIEDESGRTLPDGSLSVDADALPEGVEAGSKVVLAPTEENPRGGMIEVSSVEAQDGAAVLRGTQPELEDVFDEIDVEGVTETKGIEVIPADDVEMEQASPAARASTSLGTFKFKHKGLSFQITPSAEFKLKTGFLSIDEAYIAVNLNESVSGTLASGTSLDKRLCDINLPTSVPGLYLGISVWAEASVSGNITLSISTDTKVGARYKSGKFTPIAKNSLDDAAIDLSASARSGFDLTASLDILNKPTVDASLGAGAQFKAGDVEVRDSGMVCADVESSFYADLGMGQHDSLMHDLGISWSKDLANIALSTLHLENGNYVSKCTWSDTPTDPSGEATPARDFEYVVFDGSEGLRETPADSWTMTYTNRAWEPAKAYCGPGVYITKYVGDSSEIVVPNKIDGQPVKFISLDWTDTGLVFNGTIDVAACDDLEFLDANLGELLGTDSLPSLRYLDARSNVLPRLSLSESDGIEYIATGGNWISSVTGVVDLSGRQNLWHLDLMHHSGISKINVSNCPKLKDLYCDGGHIGAISEIEMDNVPSLEHISCSGNALTELDLSGKPNLIQLECGNNRLSSLDVSGCPKLEILSFWDNELTSIDVSRNPSLINLSCSNNPITVLDISNNPNLVTLDTIGCPIKDTSMLEEWSEDPSHHWNP